MPLAKNATPDSANNMIARATSAGWEKKAVNEPQPSTAKPRQAAVPRRMSVTLSIGSNIHHAELRKNFDDGDRWQNNSE